MNEIHTINDAESRYPLHLLVFNNQFEVIKDYLFSLKSSLSATEFKKLLEKKDNKSRTPLHLAVSLGRLEVTKILLENDADIFTGNAQNWSVLHESISTGDPEIVKLCLQHREYQRIKQSFSSLSGIKKFIESPDFSLEIYWDVSTWIPLASTLFAPNDTLKIYKKGSNIRVDSTLLGFENMKWQRGLRTVMIDLTKVENGTLYVIDHDDKSIEKIPIQEQKFSFKTTDFRISRNYVAKRLTEPTVYSYIDFSNVSIDPSLEKKFFGMKNTENQVTEKISNFQSKKYEISNIKMATRKRTDHLINDDVNNKRENFADSFFSSFKALSASKDEQLTTQNRDLTALEYFQLDQNSKIDVGRPVVASVKNRDVKVNMWLSDENPVDIKSQLLPLLDLVSLENQHLNKIKEYLSLNLPSGGLMKIEIPLFNLITATVTCRNIKTGPDLEFPDDCFVLPNDYDMQSEAYDFEQAVNNTSPSLRPMSQEDRDLQRALQLSLENQ